MATLMRFTLIGPLIMAPIGGPINEVSLYYIVFLLSHVHKCHFSLFTLKSCSGHWLTVTYTYIMNKKVGKNCCLLWTLYRSQQLKNHNGYIKLVLFQSLLGICHFINIQLCHL